MDNKEELELKKLQCEIRDLNFKHIGNIIKAITFSIVSIFLFLYIQNPEWILKKQSLKDELKRERAELMIELIKLNNYEDIKLGLTIIKETYGDIDNDWINEIENEYKKLYKERIESQAKMTEEELNAEEILKKLLEKEKSK